MSQLTVALSLARCEHTHPAPPPLPTYMPSFFPGVGGTRQGETSGGVRLEKRTMGGVGTSNYF